MHPSLLVVSLILTPALAVANDEPVAARCQTMLMAPTADRPDPFTVDPTDVDAILAFVDRVSPFPDADDGWAMHLGLAALWRRYCPELGEDEINQRLAPFERAAYSLLVIRRSTTGALTDKGRLRTVWLEFLRDIAHPLNPEPDPRLAQWAKNLMTRRNANPVVARLRELGVGPVELTVESVARAVTALWRRDFNETAPDFGAHAENPRNAAITAIWIEYLERLDKPARIGRSSFRAPRRYSKFLADAPGDFDAIHGDAFAIAKFLLKRYPTEKIKPGALARMLGQLRAEYHLNDESGPILANDLAVILYQPPRAGPARKRLEAAFAKFRRDLDARESFRPAAE